MGVLGELHIGGVDLARGYAGRPDLTAERFIPDPFGSGGRLYRTGDLGRRRADGVLEYAGRIDQQLKLRGLRIEPGEIEARLAEHPAVRAAAVVARDGQLVAYIVGEAEPEALQQHLRTSLPDYMVPAQYVDPRPPAPLRQRQARPQRPARAGTTRPQPTSPRRASPSACSARPGRTCLAWSGSVPPTTSSRWAAIRSSPSSSSAAPASTASTSPPKHVFQHQTVREMAQARGDGRDASAGGPPNLPADRPCRRRGQAAGADRRYRGCLPPRRRCSRACCSMTARRRLRALHQPGERRRRRARRCAAFAPPGGRRRTTTRPAHRVRVGRPGRAVPGRAARGSSCRCARSTGAVARCCRRCWPSSPRRSRRGASTSRGRR